MEKRGILHKKAAERAFAATHSSIPVNSVIVCNETPEAWLPLVKAYACLYCDAQFGLKLLLYWHYRQKHRNAIADFGEYVIRHRALPKVGLGLTWSHRVPY